MIEGDILYVYTYTVRFFFLTELAISTHSRYMYEHDEHVLLLQFVDVPML